MKRDCSYVGIRKTYKIALGALALYGGQNEEVDTYRLTAHALKTLVGAIEERKRRGMKKNVKVVTSLAEVGVEENVEVEVKRGKIAPATARKVLTTKVKKRTVPSRGEQAKTRKVIKEEHLPQPTRRRSIRIATIIRGMSLIII